MEKAEGNLKPNLFIIGAPKSGTTSLSDYLCLYKEVSFSVLKEPFFIGLKKSRTIIRLIPWINI